MEQIYLDYNATTPIDPEVASEMRPFLEEYFGNPSSSHEYGVKARLAVEKARRNVALLLNCSPSEIIFTSGGTESNNMALKGAAFAGRNRGNHIIISAVEHPAVTEVAAFLAKNGFEISIAPVDGLGIVKIDEIKKLFRAGTILVSVMHANNETGAIQPIEEISAIAHQYGAIMHTDAAQSAGKIEADIAKLHVDLLSVAGHKLYAPKGIGALYIRNGVAIEKLMHGADHEQNLRAGTENVLEIVGLGKACEIARKGLDSYTRHTRNLKNQLIDGLRKELGELHIHGNPDQCLPNTLSVGFRNLNAQTLLSAMPGIAASAGAACHTGTPGVSGVLSAMQVPAEYSLGTIRFSLGRYSTEEEIEKAIKLIAKGVKSLKPEGTEQNTIISNGEKIRLTQYTHGMGCACKIRPADLEKILSQLPAAGHFPNVMIGAENNDDAAVYRISDDLALVQTVDFFTPVVDDPYQFGAIAAANSLSDVYAMGAKPVFALNIAAFPVNRLPLEVLQQIIKGASDKAAEAGIPVLGGHSIEDNEPKFGMVVSGLVHPDKVLSNGKALPGDLIYLTKPLGNGIIATAGKLGLAEESILNESMHWMAMLNALAANCMEKVKVSTCTDVTGFGLAGHLHEITKASQVNAEICFHKLPFIKGVEELALASAIPGGSRSNYESAQAFCDFGSLNSINRLMMCDAQTSGGLLICLQPEEAEKIETEFRKTGQFFALIGRISDSGSGLIHVVD